jgi:nicotinamide-nucleotide amidase
MRASVLTIGTEITSGEIINSNAAWIAQRLEEQGHVVTDHLSVRDDRKDILRALKYLESSQILIVTGGLGPTSDDITREMMAKWIGSTLTFSKKIWKEFKETYAARGLSLREAHRHQCYFPKKSEILRNPVGTAHGFVMKRKKTSIFVLPGPPRELEGMWPAVADQIPNGDAPKWEHWSCLGLPESEVAELIEPLIDGLDIEVGYRASIPYVHLKLRGSDFTGKISGEIDQRLGSNIVSKGKKDFAQTFVESLEGKDILFQDQVTKGFLSARLTSFARKNPKLKFRLEECIDGKEMSPGKADIVAQVTKTDDPNAFQIIWRDKKNVQKATRSLPFKIAVDSERGAKSATEWALYQWFNWSR